MWKSIAGLILLTALLANAHAQLQVTLAPKVVSETDPLDDASEVGGLLEAHNAVRQADNVGPLRWDTDLASYAQVWANHLADNSCRAEHRPATGEMAQQHGENIYWTGPVTYADGTAMPQKVSGAYVARRWAQEKANYDYATNRCAPGKVCGHYTQMVWAASERVGCARALCANQGQIWVCNYSPRGNYTSERPYGDPPPPTVPDLNVATVTETATTPIETAATVTETPSAAISAPTPAPVAPKPSLRPTPRPVTQIAALTPIGTPDAPTRESATPGAVAYQDLRDKTLPYYVQCAPEDAELGRLAVAQRCGRITPPARYDTKVFSPARIELLRSRLNSFDLEVAAYRTCTTDYISTYRQDGFDATSRTAYEAACAHNWAEVELTQAAADYVQACYHYNDHAPGQGHAPFDPRCIP